jgi:hypothetical protein
MIKILMAQILFSFISLLEASENMGNCNSVVVNERLPNVISSDMTLSASKVYGIDKRVVIENNAVLNIEPGTTLAGCSLFSYLVVTQDSKIIAKGTKNKPIIFTSQMDLLGYSSAGRVGEWGGVVIAGNAYTHYKDNKYEADESISFGSQLHDKDYESSGILEYVLIKHTGYQVKKDKELNGLSLAGVGGGTVMKNIAIVGGSDDGVEIWGGKVNIDGLYVYNAKDDSVDVDMGYSGKINNVLVVQNKVDSKNNHDSSAMEFGNDENLITTNETNATLPTISNLTAYIKGGGIYNKYDAGFRVKNIKIISNKKKDYEMVYFRGKDSYSTGAKYIDGDVCLCNTKLALKLDELFSKTNSKQVIQSYTAYDFFIRDNKQLQTGEFLTTNSCVGVNEKRVWKGKKGSFEAIE